MLSRFSAFVIWAAVGAGIVFWGLRLFDRPTPPPAEARLVSPAAALQGDVARVLGSEPVVSAGPQAAPVADARFRLIGVVAPRSASARDRGVALIAFDGKPPRAYRVGSKVDGDWVLQAVHVRGVSIGPRGQAAQLALELPALPPPSVGVPSGAAVPALPAVRPPRGIAPPVPPAVLPPPAEAPGDPEEAAPPGPQAPQRPT